MAYVIYSDDAGVYLGSCMGLGFWSNWDPVSQDQAITFPTIEALDAYVESWDKTNGHPDFEPREVTPDKGEYASIAACVAAGLPAWDPERKSRGATTRT